MFIEYKGDRTSLVWKAERAQAEDIISVEKYMKAVLVGENTEVFSEGEHTASQSGEVYYVPEGAVMEADWQTDSPVIKGKVSYNAGGALEISVADEKIFCCEVDKKGSLEKVFADIFSSKLVGIVQAALDGTESIDENLICDAVKTVLEDELKTLGITLEKFTLDEFSKVRKSYKKLAVGISLGAAVIAAATAVVVSVIIPSIKYSGAVKAMNNNDYITAYETFKELGGYRDSEQKLAQIEKPVLLQRLNSKNVGDKVFFGEFEQDNDLSSPEPLEWRVLAKEDNKMLLLTDKCITNMPFNNELKIVSWEDCSLRKWLNNEFKQTAFSEQMSSMILTTQNLTYTEGGSAEGMNKYYSTKDDVFLLGIEEVYKYFPVYEEKVGNATAYCEATGAYVDTEVRMCWWWSRTPGLTQEQAAFVDFEGFCNNSGMNVINDKLTVRPAIWVTLE